MAGLDKVFHLPSEISQTTLKSIAMVPKMAPPLNLLVSGTIRQPNFGGLAVFGRPFTFYECPLVAEGVEELCSEAFSMSAFTKSGHFLSALG
jgi:hypothetical protein